MIKKLISYNELKEAIHAAFVGDNAIFELYDPNVKVWSIEELYEDVLRKIKEYEGVSIYSVYEQNELVGYFVNIKNQLISFGLSIKYRIVKYLNDFFEIIKKELGEHIFVYLWKTNKRAIKWLQKHGLVEIYSDNIIIKLQCQ